MTRQTDSKRGEQRVLTQVRLPVDLWEQLRYEADQRDVSMNFLVMRAITRYLPTLTPVEDFVDG